MDLQFSWVVYAHDAVAIAGSTYWLGRVLHSWVHCLAFLQTHLCVLYHNPETSTKYRNQKGGERSGDSNISGNHFPWDPAITTVEGFSNPEMSNEQECQRKNTATAF